MRIRPHLVRGLGCLFFVFAARVASGCDQLPAGQALWIRLAAPISTYTAKPGDPVHAVLTQDLVCDNEIVLPMGVPIEGIVRSRRKVGWGIRHETAALELEFTRATARPGLTVDLSARVEEVENAREHVHNGVIQGIRASETFQGSITSRLIHLPTWNPYPDPILLAFKATFPIFPEPEIYYPAGTDIRLRTTKQFSAPPEAEVSEYDSSPAATEEWDRARQLVAGLPVRVTTKKHADADLVNIVFLGSGDQVISAFLHAGWSDADPGSKRAWMKDFYALLNNSGYAHQPMMTFLLNDRPEDMKWQKNLNSYGRRDHLRLWQWNPARTGGPVWVASSTHDVAAMLNVKHKGFVHHIAPDIDEERSTVVRDLSFAGCVKSVSYVPRPEMISTTHNAIGDIMITDGAVAVVELQDCTPADPQVDPGSIAGAYKPGNHAFRYIRRGILTFRNDIFRGNIIYGAYDVGRRTVTALRRKPVIAEKPTANPTQTLTRTLARSANTEVGESH